MTSGGKGWGLRTLVDVQKGTFICEYVGEILTLSEHYLRYQTSLQYCAYTMILDAGWASSKEIKDDKDKPLCLDASVYGNVARFINHRCYCSIIITCTEVMFKAYQPEICELLRAVSHLQIIINNHHMLSTFFKIQ